MRAASVIARSRDREIHLSGIPQIHEDAFACFRGMNAAYAHKSWLRVGYTCLTEIESPTIGQRLLPAPLKSNFTTNDTTTRTGRCGLRGGVLVRQHVGINVLALGGEEVVDLRIGLLELVARVLELMLAEYAKTFHLNEGHQL